MSPTTAMFWPMIAHAFLVFGLYVLLFLRRKKFTFSNADTFKQFRDSGEEAVQSQLVNKNIANQFEIPVLFHAACLLLYITDADNIVTIILGWIFVFSRFLQSYAHVTSKSLRYRAPAFAAGFAALVLMWAWLAIWLALE
ncbi:MAPEG family protein [Agrobacterium larrymoorei]|uniref:MAPEG family protein n=1 Tax=Agrobacterium larrymoorei TaxID=160699 RepID=UPI001F1C41D3|nr:MAPEG family protein [Agrobacterium larrymoorei]